MNKHFMHLDDEPFKKIFSGNKTIELRLNDGKRQEIKIDDEIEFVNNDSGKHILVLVSAIHTFSSFNELYNALSLEKCGYAIDEIGHVSAADMEKYYSIEDQNRYGVIGIEFVLLDK